MSSAKKLMGTTAVGGALAIEDVFSTYLYTGTGTTNTITNGIDLAGEGGLVWLKARSLAQGHTLTDTERGSNFVLQPNTTDAQVNTGSLYVSSFNSDGFSIGTGSNTSSQTFASWTFRKAPRFFDVVTYTGDGVSGRTISHNLGVAPGCVIVKRTDSTRGWGVYHRSIGATNYLVLESTQAAAASTGLWNDTEPTDSVFTVGNNLYTNGAGATYVAYLFAHDPLGPSGDGSDGLIACGSYTGNGSATGPVIDLGWEPQWVMVKNATTAANWHINDNMRGMSVNSYAWLYPNLSNAESYTSPATVVSPTATGFKIETTGTVINNSGDNYIYIAIRRGPMRQPTSGTEVFSPNTIGAVSVGTPVTTNFPVDLQIATWRGGTSSHYFYDRLRGVSSTTTEGAKSLLSDSTAAETSPTTATRMWGNTGYQVDTSWSNSVSIFHNFRRAPGFFDVVAYTGDGVAGRTVPHNLGVAPELMIVKRRNGTNNWAVYHTATGATDVLFLNTTAATTSNSFYWNNTDPTADNFILSTGLNTSTYTYIAYLFASCPGVSKVGSYAGNGSSQTIDCGFTGGARFVLIKRTDSTGDWYVWDTARGIVAGNDPHLSLNTAAAEVTTDDSVDPDNSGFIVNQVAATNINVSSASYIYLAVS